ncbi:bifunctional diguanylate cyclase/phosphodiesterase [Burkholderia sp. SCN-KJ]|uniref:putative bifunctional diguanylate cyclase/phosphodiesterase n=1 Tax=Burkholderia sp. SCN-KJ TaxID=2969248 RepID=UPI0021504CC1|nr:GGDEF domain-containing phosphodiesterase [Burkholderia sp. SCN-KJ]MCR4470458.1 EAL domain-containing protein [Burkholderia sp. SCN-KJ]
MSEEMSRANLANAWSPSDNTSGEPRSSDAQACALRFEQAAFQAAHPMFLCDADGMLRWVNRAFEALTGYPAAMHVDRSKIQELLVSTGGVSCNAHVVQLNRSRWFVSGRLDALRLVQVDISQLNGAPPPGAAATAGEEHTFHAHSMVEYVGILVECGHEQISDYQRWYASNFADSMQLPNRRLFADRLDLRIAHAHAVRERFSVLMFALSGLETIRNVFGQPGVEMIVKVIGERLRSRIPRAHALTSIGEWKLALLSDEASEKLIDMVVSHACEPVEFSGARLRVAVHGGIVTYPDDGEDVGTLMRRAEVALSSARDAEANGVVHFSCALDVRAARRFELESMLAYALERRQCWLTYQPQVTVETGHVAQIEALIRWKHPSHGEISPDEFIPIAEQCGMIDKIGEWVIHTACQEFCELRRVVPHLIRVCVNVSPQQFKRGNLLEIIQAALRRSGLAPQCLEIEITEGVLFTDTQRALQTIRAIRELGVEVAVDDFGTGYSSLSYLTRFPINRVKIDRSFIAGLPDDAGSSELVSAIIVMAHALKMRVTAEGVETVEQADRLRKLGCDEAQGFWYSQPHTIGTLRTILTN